MSNVKKLLNYLFETRTKLIDASYEVNSEDRVTVFSSNAIGRLQVNRNIHYSQPSRNPNKPNGLWYAFGSDWIDLITNREAGMSNFVGENNEVYKVGINNANVKQINNINDLREFHELFYDPALQNINWENVAKQYDGFEIKIEPETQSANYRWLRGWDIKSGCIWNLFKINLEAVNTLRRGEDQIEEQINNWWWSDVFSQNWENAHIKINNIANSIAGKENIEFLKQDILSKLTNESEDLANAIGIESNELKSNIANQLILNHTNSILYEIAKEWAEQNK